MEFADAGVVQLAALRDRDVERGGLVRGVERALDRQMEAFAERVGFALGE